MNKKFSLFYICDTCEKPRRVNQYDVGFVRHTTCKICEQSQLNDAMDALYEFQTEEAERQGKNRKEIFNTLRETLCDDFIKDIYECIEECEGGFDFEIVEKPKGDSQEEYYRFIKHIWVDQSCGVCGDDYYGEVYIPLPDNKYLQFSYQC